MKTQEAALETPTDLSRDAVAEISRQLMPLLADVFALYMKTKNFHWHMSGPYSAITTCCWINMASKSLR